MNKNEEQMILAFKWRARVTGDLIRKIIDEKQAKYKNHEQIFKELKLDPTVARFCINESIRI